MADTDWSFFDIPATAVQDNLTRMTERADGALATANAVISQLEQVRFDPEPAAPNPPDLNVTVPRPVTPKIADYDRFGRANTFNEPTFEDLWAQLGVSQGDFDLSIAPFVSNVPPPVFPAEPDPLDSSGKPVRPAVNTDIDIPVAPDLLLPTLDALRDTALRDITFPTLPTFDALAPEFTAAAPNTSIIFTEPTYVSTVESDLVLRIRAMLAGEVIPVNIQQALFDQARSREASTALEAEQAAFDSFAGKGFGMPPGMLVESVRRTQEKSRLEQNAQARDIFSKVGQWQIENLRKAVEQGMAYETLLRNQFNNVATRSFEMAKFRVESDIKLYDSEVAIFNARNSAYATLAQVFKIRIDSALEVLKDQINLEVQRVTLDGQFNEQNVRVYTARLEGVKQIVSIFHEKMQAALTQAEVAKAILAGYGEDVKAYAEKLSAEKERFTAYYERVRAEAEKSKALEYEARAYEATVRGTEAKASLKGKYVDARVAAMRESVAKFASLVEAERDSVTASLQAIQANAAGFVADTGRYTAEIQGVNESVRTDLLIQQEDTRNKLALWEATVKEYDTRLSRMLEQTKIVVSALDAAARTSSTLAAGAMSAIHVQASMSGSGNASSTNAYNVNINRQGADVA